MSTRDKTPVPAAVASIWPAAVLLAVALGMFAWSETYSQQAAQFPAMVAMLMILLAILDLLSRVKGRLGDLVRRIGGAGFDRREMTHNPTARAEWSLVLWIAGAFAAMAVIGILPATPLFCTLFTRYRGQRSWRAALTVGVAVLAFQYVIFEWLLDYQLYRGLILARGGVSAW